MEDIIKTLHNYEDFSKFISCVYELREDAIRAMRDRGTNGVLQLSGEIAACDEILRLADWEKLRTRYLVHK